LHIRRRSSAFTCIITMNHSSHRVVFPRPGHFNTCVQYLWACELYAEFESYRWMTKAVGGNLRWKEMRCTIQKYFNLQSVTIVLLQRLKAGYR
jgi:hypothetical protein